MNFNPRIHHRRSIRLKGYDYSQAGLYFITICCDDRRCLFGEITIGAENFPPTMKLNDAGKIANECWLQIPEHFPNVILHEYVVMPNHVHGIIELNDVNNVIAQNSGEQNTGTRNADAQNSGARNVGAQNVGAQNFVPLPPPPLPPNERISDFEPQQNQFQKIIPRSIGSIVRGYKIGVTKWFRNKRMEGFENFQPQRVWQRNYYEHIIRDERSYQNISKYIINNPVNWKEDKFHLSSKG